MFVSPTHNERSAVCFEYSDENKLLTLTAHVHFISDAVYSLATALLNDGPGALPPLKV